MANPFFEWDEYNSTHIAKHNLSQEQPEQVIFNRPLDLEKQNKNGEERFVNLGETDAGLVLLVVSTRRLDGAIRVVTAWPAKERLRRYFISHKEAGNAGRSED